LIHRRTTRGFTFIELMVVLAIIGLAAAVVVPAMDAGINAREVRRATLQIAATMHHMCTEAKATGRPRRMRIKPNENAIETDDRSKWATLSDRAIIERIDGGLMAGDGTVEIQFYANGSTSGAYTIIASRADRSTNRYGLHLDALTCRTWLDP
jgi:type II secretion system protein H